MSKAGRIETGGFERLPGEVPELHDEVWARRLEDEVQMARAMGMEAHTRLVSVDDEEHEVELSEGVDSVEAGPNRTVRILLASGAIVTVTGGAVVAALALIRHRRRKS